MSLTAKDAERYKELEELKMQAEREQQDLLSKPVVYGYARVSTKRQETDGNSLEAQERVLRSAGATEIIRETYTGTSTDRPELDRLMQELKEGDTLIISKLDRMARSTLQGLQLVQDLIGRGVTVNILNMGLLSNKPEDALRLTMFLAFAQYERDMIMQRTREGKEIARQKAGYHEGRPKKYSQKKLEYAVELLESHSYLQVAEITGISKSTLIRAKTYCRKLAENNRSDK